MIFFPLWFLIVGEKWIYFFDPEEPKLTKHFSQRSLKHCSLPCSCISSGFGFVCLWVSEEWQLVTWCEPAPSLTTADPCTFFSPGLAESFTNIFLHNMWQPKSGLVAHSHSAEWNNWFRNHEFSKCWHRNTPATERWEHVAHFSRITLSWLNGYKVNKDILSKNSIKCGMPQ